MRSNVAHMHAPGAYPDAFTDETFFCIEEQLGYDYTVGTKNHQSASILFPPLQYRVVSRLLVLAPDVSQIVYLSVFFSRFPS